MRTKRLLVSIALSSMLVAYDFDATKFQSTEWSEFQKQETTAPFYVWKIKIILQQAWALDFALVVKIFTLPRTTPK